MGIRIGIDPGMSGAIARIDSDGAVTTWDMPVVAKSSGKGKEVNSAELAGIMAHISASRDVNDIIFAFVERVHAMPGNGATSMFNFGMALGVVKGVMAALAIPYVMPTPQSWKKRAGLIGKDKDYARTLAIQLYPAYADQFRRKKDIGRADAVLIARYGE